MIVDPSSSSSFSATPHHHQCFFPTSSSSPAHRHHHNLFHTASAAFPDPHHFLPDPLLSPSSMDSFPSANLPPPWLLHNAHLLPFLTNVVGTGNNHSNDHLLHFDPPPPPSLLPPSAEEKPHPLQCSMPPLPLPKAEEGLPCYLDNYSSSERMLDDAMGCAYSRIDASPALPLGISSVTALAAAAAAASSRRLPHAQLTHDSLDLEHHYLAELQALLRSEYGVSLSMNQILDVAYDTLPDLTPALVDYHVGADQQFRMMPMEQDQFQQRQQSEDVVNPIRSASTTSSDLMTTNMRESQRHSCRPPPGTDTRSGSGNQNTCASARATQKTRSGAPSEVSSPSPMPDGGLLICHTNMLLPTSMEFSSSAEASPDSFELEDGSVLKRMKLQGITLEQVLAAEQQQQSQKSGCESGENMISSSKKRKGRECDDHHEKKGAARVAAEKKATLVEERGKKSDMASGSGCYSSVEPQSIAARNRRKRIREKTESLGMLIPGATRLDTAAMFDLAIKYVNFLQAQMQCLEKEAEQQQQYNVSWMGSRVLMHRLLSSPDIQHFLAREGYCLVSHSLASSSSSRLSAN